MFNALGVHTIEELGKWKFFLVRAVRRARASELKTTRQAARAITVLAENETGQRPEGSTLNVNHILDKEFETKSFKDIAKAPPSAFSGLAQWTDTVLKTGRIRTIKQLGTWKFCVVRAASRLAFARLTCVATTDGRGARPGGAV